MPRNFSFAVAVIAVCGAAKAQIGQLQPGQSVGFVLKGGETREFGLTLGAGQFAPVSAHCPEASVTASIRQRNRSASGPELLSSVISLGGTGGSARMAALAETSGEYVITVRSSAVQTDARKCELTVEAVREATEADRKDALAHRAMASTVKDYARAAALATSAGDEALADLATILRARSLVSAGKYTDARQLIRDALAGPPPSRDRKTTAAMLYMVGLTSIFLEDNRSAIEALEAARPLQQSERQVAESAVSLHNLSVARWSVGECRSALVDAEEALRVRRSIGDARGEGFTLLAIAKDHLCLGDSQDALDTYAKALEAWRALKDEQQEAGALNDLGILYVQMGDYAQSGAFHNQALEIRRRTKDISGQAESLNNIGQLRHNTGDYAGARAAYEEALKLQRSNHFTRGEGYALQGLADASEAMGRHEQALIQAKESVRLLHEIGERAGEGYAWQVVARCYLGMQRRDEAHASFLHALELEREVGQQKEQAETLTALAGLELSQGRPEESLTRIEEGLALIEHGRAGVISPDLRSKYAAKNREAYELAVNVSMQLAKKNPSGDFERTAFGFSERTHARGLLDSLAENQAGIREGADPVSAARQKELEQELNAKMDSLARTRPADKSRVDREIGELLRRSEQLAVALRQTSPRYAALTSPQPPDVAEVQKLLSADSVLLEYLASPDKTWLWAIEQNRLTTFQLPGRKELGVAVTRLYSSLTARNRTDSSETLAQRQMRIARSDVGSTILIKRLRTLLVPRGAVGAQHRTVLVVADDLLHHVPFSALMPQSSVVMLPSAGMLQELKSRSNQVGLRSSLLLIADPVFSADDERLGPARRQGVPDTGEPVLTRLRRSRDEVAQIAVLSKPAETVIATGLEASPAVLKGDDLSQFGLIHIASHAILNDSRPELSGIALSSFDRNGAPQPGFLRLHEIYNLRLRSGLVTLSACGTALGPDVRGEGLVSLARGFLFAGTSRVLASLWSVDDRATEEFMARFYSSIYKQGLAPAAALHAAAVSMRRNGRWASPYYWGGFVLQGDPE